MSDGYKGDITPEETLKLLQDDEHTTIVDVRTIAEWKLVGMVDISHLPNKILYIEWVDFPDRKFNENFITDLKAAVSARNGSIYFLCRTGVRSAAAAKLATLAGYENCYNIIEGFEGATDDKGRRGRITGWQGRDLPWKH